MELKCPLGRTVFYASEKSRRQEKEFKVLSMGKIRSNVFFHGKSEQKKKKTGNHTNGKKVNKYKMRTLCTSMYLSALADQNVSKYVRRLE
jgi:hypothetical protein